MDWAAATQKKPTPIATPKERIIFVIDLLPGLYAKEGFHKPADQSKLTRRYQINVMHHAGVVHLSHSLTLCNFLPQIRQPNIGTVLLN